MKNKLLVVLTTIRHCRWHGGSRAPFICRDLYDETKTVKVEGNLVQFLFRNPHSFVHIMAPDDTRPDAEMGCGVGAALVSWADKA